MYQQFVGVLDQKLEDISGNMPKNKIWTVMSVETIEMQGAESCTGNKVE